MLAGTAACGVEPMVELGKNMRSKERQRISTDLNPIPHPRAASGEGGKKGQERRNEFEPGKTW